MIRLAIFSAALQSSLVPALAQPDDSVPPCSDSYDGISDIMGDTAFVYTTVKGAKPKETTTQYLTTPTVSISPTTTTTKIPSTSTWRPPTQTYTAWKPASKMTDADRGIMDLDWQPTRTWVTEHPSTQYGYEDWGCYAMGHARNKLYTDYKAEKMTSKTTALDLCKLSCQPADWFAVAKGDTCVCLGSIDRYSAKQVSPEQCDMSCGGLGSKEGNHKFACGGNETMNVYKTVGNDVKSLGNCLKCRPRSWTRRTWNNLSWVTLSTTALMMFYFWRHCGGVFCFWDMPWSGNWAGWLFLLISCVWLNIGLMMAYYGIKNGMKNPDLEKFNMVIRKERNGDSEGGSGSTA